MIELLISSAILITILAIIRVLFRGRIPPGFQYALWLLVLLRLALPFHLFPSPVSAAGAITQAIRVEQADEAGQTVLQTNSNVSIDTYRQAAEKPSFERIIGYAWLGGSLIMALWFGVVNLKLTIRLRHNRRRLEYSAPIPIYIADELSSPCLYGIFRPAVYLTEQAASDPQRTRIAIAHELTHWRHRDNLWSTARVLCLIVYWYDPFVWLAAFLSKQDCELFCDACAIRIIGEEHRFAYGRALLEMSEAVAHPSDLICSASTMSGGARRMRERINSIAHKPRRSILLSIAAVIVTLFTVACTFSGSSEALEAKPMEITPTSPPLIVETPIPVEVIATLPPASKSEADTEETVVPTPVPTQEPANTPTPAPVQNTSSTPVPIESTAQEDATVDETPSGGGGIPRIQWVEAASGGSPSQQTLSPAETEAPADDATPPSATPPTEETESVIVRDMRDVYMNSDLEPYPDMPSTVPDSPPPETAPET